MIINCYLDRNFNLIKSYKTLRLLGTVTQSIKILLLNNDWRELLF